MDKPKRISWEEAIQTLRNQPEHQDLIFNSYLTSDLSQNVRRFFDSFEFKEVLKVISFENPNARNILDMPGGNGIATYAFAKSGFSVTSVEPDGSNSVGRGAIEFVLKQDGLTAEIVNAYGENLPFPDETFDVVYVRQGLHHAADLPKMLKQISRVLKTGGILIACREHVVDNYGKSLQDFLDAQVDHQLYGGENAFTLQDYLSAIRGAKLRVVRELAPFDSEINLYPGRRELWEKRILTSTPGRVLNTFMPKKIVLETARFLLNRRQSPGRLYTFIARKTD